MSYIFDDDGDYNYEDMDNSEIKRIAMIAREEIKDKERLTEETEKICQRKIKVMKAKNDKEAEIKAMQEIDDLNAEDRQNYDLTTEEILSKNKLILKISKDQFEIIKDFLAIFNDALEINNMIDDSCVSCLLALKKSKQKDMEKNLWNFLNAFGKVSEHLEQNEKFFSK